MEQEKIPTNLTDEEINELRENRRKEDNNRLLLAQMLMLSGTMNNFIEPENKTKNKPWPQYHQNKKQKRKNI